MRLIECYIENFGTFREYRSRFDRGLNCIHSDNGTGKTTLSIFITSMLYGLPDTKKQNLDENERKKYSPWQGGRFGGSLTFEVESKTYTVERTFGSKASDDLFTLRDKMSGAISTDYSENLGEELFGIDRDGFFRTVCLSEKNLSIKNGNKSISAKLSDLVGVDGDVGGFDAALELLEKKRKFYYKQSGNCEITNTKNKITEKKLELDRLNATAARAEEKEMRLRALLEEKNLLNEQKRSLSDKLTDAAKRKERAASEERYSAMLAKVKNDRIRLAELEEFFGGSVPDPSVIDEARFSLFEGQRLIRELSQENGNGSVSEERYATLNFEKLGDAERKYAELISTDHALKTAEAGEDDELSKIRGLFPLSLPTDEDITGCTRAYGKKGLIFNVLLTIVGIFAALFGVTLGMTVEPLMFTAAAVGAILFITGATLILLKREKGRKCVRDLIEKTGRRGDTPSRETLFRIEVDLEICRDLLSRREAKKAYLSERYRELYSELVGFIDEYSLIKTGNMSIDLDSIKRGYTDYYTTAQTGASGIDPLGERRRTAEEMISRAKLFLSGYETRTDDPFAELSSLAAEYSYTKVALERGTRECDEYAQKYGTTGDYAEGLADIDTTNDARLIGECEMRLTEISREYGMLLGEYERDMRECEKLDGIQAEIDELNDTLARYIENYEIIKATCALLSEACDNMTSRYIGKTREGFLKYEGLIGGEGGDFALDTCFTVTKSDRGANRGEECYSRGTRDLYALALRLALIDTLFEGEEPFIILDDPFIAFDDEKCKRGRKLLSELAKTKQILYFTCSSSRAV